MRNEGAGPKGRRGFESQVCVCALICVYRLNVCYMCVKRMRAPVLFLLLFFSEGGRGGWRGGGAGGISAPN